jgi:hypothetical protein
MEFSDFRLILPTVFSNRTNPIELVQSAYKDVVNKISLHLHLFQVLVDGCIGLDGFNHVHKYVKGTVESEIAFKEIYSILGISFSGELVDKEYTLTQGTVGDILDTFFPDTELVNDEEYMWIGSDLVPLDRQVSKIGVHGYAYPYFCKTVGGVETDPHYYDIQDMIDEYGESNLIIDDLIGVLTALKTKVLYLLEQGNVNESATVEYFYTQLLNQFNESREQFFVHGFDSLTEQTTKAI